MKQYGSEPLSDWEVKKVAAMIENGATEEGAVKSRYALRRKKRVCRVEAPKKKVVTTI